MNIEGLSEKTLEQLLSHGWVHTFGNLYTLEQHREEIIQTEGFGVKSFERMQASIEKSRHCTLAQFIAGMGIPMVGRHAGRNLDRYFHGSWEAFEQAIQDRFDFTQLPDFGEIMRGNIYTWYEDAEAAKLWRPLLDHIEFMKEDQPMQTTNGRVPALFALYLLSFAAVGYALFRTVRLMRPLGLEKKKLLPDLGITLGAGIFFSLDCRLCGK